MLMVEARRAERVRSFLRARISFNNGNTTVDCIIRNISATGAKIEVSSAVSVPTEFDLDVPQKGRVFRARMMWRDADYAGLHFVDEDKGTSDPVDNSRLEKLTAENRKLKATVAALTKRLEDLGQDVSESY